MSRRFKSKSKTRSRPRRRLRTRPADPRAPRCRVIACRVTPVPALSRVMESGPSAERRRNRPSRVESASAANTGTASRSLRSALLLDIARELLRLRVPPLGVHPERFGTAVERDPVEPRFDDRERCAIGFVFEPELDQRRRLTRVIDV